MGALRLVASVHPARRVPSYLVARPTPVSAAARCRLDPGDGTGGSLHADAQPDFLAGFAVGVAASGELLRLTGRSEEQLALVEAYAKAQGLWHDPSVEPVYSESVLGVGCGGCAERR